MENMGLVSSLACAAVTVHSLSQGLCDSGGLVHAVSFDSLHVCLGKGSASLVVRVGGGPQGTAQRPGYELGVVPSQTARHTHRHLLRLQSWGICMVMGWTGGGG